MTAARAYDAWGGYPLPANDNRRPLMVGLTGKRNVGKSTVACLLEQEFGFDVIHAFDSGKAMARLYFERVTGDELTAARMVYGDLKDKPSPHLPGNASPRYFMERFGHFMGVDMGVEWTLDVEIKRARRRSPNAPIAVESVVYEAPHFKVLGGVIVRLERPGFESPVGVSSDSAQALVEADYTLSADSVLEMEDKARRLFGNVVRAAA